MNRPEPVYRDDPWDDRDMSIGLAGLYCEEECRRVFLRLRRTRLMFQSDTEMSRWRRIDKGLHNGTIPIEWINDRLEHARERRWSLTTLMNAILNTGKMDAWMLHNMPRTIETEVKDITEERRSISH